MTIQRREFLTSALVTATALTCQGQQNSQENSSGSNEEENARRREQLAPHRITNIEVGSVQIRWPRLVGRNARLGVHGRGPRVNVCRLTTNRGASGWGILRGSLNMANALRNRFRNRALTEIFDPGTGVTDETALPLDFALHDLAGIILEIPVYQMLGSHGPESSPCYSGMIYFDDIEPLDNPPGIDRVLENCRADVARGYRQLKVKIGRGNRWMPRQAGIGRDIDVTREIARTLPNITILVDANDGYTPDDMIRYLDGIGDVELFWIEEPFRENVHNFRRLKQWLRDHQRNTFLADGEANPDHTVLGQLMEQDLLDVHLIDIAGYGFTAWRRFMPGLRRQNVQASPHAWGNILKTYYVSHLARGLGNVVTVEGVTCTCDQVDFGQYRLQDGQLTPSPQPGFGMRLNLS